MVTISRFVEQADLVAPRQCERHQGPLQMAQLRVEHGEIDLPGPQCKGACAPSGPHHVPDEIVAAFLPRRENPRLDCATDPKAIGNQDIVCGVGAEPGQFLRERIRQELIVVVEEAQELPIGHLGANAPGQRMRAGAQADDPGVGSCGEPIEHGRADPVPIGNDKDGVAEIACHCAYRVARAFQQLCARLIAAGCNDNRDQGAGAAQLASDGRRPDSAESAARSPLMKLSSVHM